MKNPGDIKIVIAEDETMMLRAIEFRLKKEGYTIFTAEDGKKTLELALKEKPDLIISDIMMPFISGLELVSLLKSKEETKSIPIIILSAVGQENTVLEGFSLGVEDYITKPFSPNELAVRVKKALKL